MYKEIFQEIRFEALSPKQLIAQIKSEDECPYHY